MKPRRLLRAFAAIGLLAFATPAPAVPQAARSGTVGYALERGCSNGHLALQVDREATDAFFTGNSSRAQILSKRASDLWYYCSKQTSDPYVHDWAREFYAGDLAAAASSLSDSLMVVACSQLNELAFATHYGDVRRKALHDKQIFCGSVTGQHSPPASQPAPTPVSSSGVGTGLTICDKTSSQISIAVGYHSSGPNDTSTALTGPFVSAGWWVIPSQQCATAANPFGARYMFWWGYYSTRRPLWSSGTYGLCVPDAFGSYESPQFNFEDENESEQSCVGAPPDANGTNLWVGAREVDTDVMTTVYFDGQ